uniref:Chitin-binding type-2 domain-containing protein n=1 Tax=Faxonius propinquus nudivirus TaxID=3139431 RepID=A0AAU8GE08_9VIRU
MEYKYLIVSLVFLFLIIIYYYLMKPKKEILQQVFDQHSLYHSEPVLALTYKQKNNNYENYYLNTDTGLLEKKIQDFPVWTNGLKYLDEAHGDVNITNDGFIVSGIETSTFKCPDKWKWSVLKNSCDIEPLCNLNEAGFIKGLTYYQFEIIDVDQKEAPQYHPRLYIYCLSNTNYELRSCENNTIYNQKDIQDGNIIPCNFYDVCSEKQNFTTHREKISNLYDLKDNEYYICLNGISTLRSCEEPLVFNTSTISCMSVNSCWGEIDGSTIKVDDFNFIYCKSEMDVHVNCQFGLFTNTTGQIECAIDTSKKFNKYFENDYFSYPISAFIYENNTQIEQTCDADKKYISHPLKDQSAITIYPTKSTNLYDPIPYNIKVIEYTNELMTDTICKSVDINNSSYIRKNYITASYNKNSLLSIYWNFLFDKPVGDKIDYIYYNLDGDIMNSLLDIKVGNAIDFIPFLYSNDLYQIKNVINKDVDITNGLTFAYTVSISYPITILSGYAFILYRNIDRYSMLIFNHLINAFLIIDWSLDIVDSTCFLIDDFTINDNTYSGINLRPKFFNITLPSFKRNSCIFQLSSILWYRDFELSNYVIRPQFLLPITYKSLIDLDYKFKIVRTIPVTLKSNINNMLEELYVEIVSKPTIKDISSYFTDTSVYFKPLLQNITNLFITKYEL